jgi:hypothetical protein
MMRGGAAPRVRQQLQKRPPKKAKAGGRYKVKDNVNGAVARFIKSKS